MLGLGLYPESITFIGLGCVQLVSTVLVLYACKCTGRQNFDDDRHSLDMCSWSFAGITFDTLGGFLVPLARQHMHWDTVQINEA